ncbi:MAG: ABC transporter substrate-binding protein, partial [Paracoccaceae bacterium]|nr:ABC transporter substrate-binding protein [Paracoccaceae bacterium]
MSQKGEEDMTLSKLYATMMKATALSVAIAGSVSAADLEFYFPVGVNAPAVETIQALTDEWATANPQHTVKAVYAGNYEDTTTKA